MKTLFYLLTLSIAHLCIAQQVRLKHPLDSAYQQELFDEAWNLIEFPITHQAEIKTDYFLKDFKSKEPKRKNTLKVEEYKEQLKKDSTSFETMYELGT